jgi:hypothetical protein
MPALMKKFGCERTYPKKLYDKVVKHGSVTSTWSHAGRPAEFSPQCWDAMITIIREHRTQHRVASSRDLSASLKKAPARARKKSPSFNTSGRTCSRWSRGRAEIFIRTSCIYTVPLQAC